MISQLPGIRKTIPDYNSYALATAEQLLASYQNKNTVTLHANNLQSSFIRNDGKGKFTMMPLPVQAQFSIINGMSVEDFDGDGNLDVVINGNDYGTEVSIGRYDALNGLFLKGDGKGNFSPLSILQSGIYIQGNGKALVMLESADKKCLLAASQNRGPLKIMQLRKQDSIIRYRPDEISAEITYRNGQTQKREISFGTSFLSQSARILLVNKSMKSVLINDAKGGKRVINF